MSIPNDFARNVGRPFWAVFSWTAQKGHPTGTFLGLLIAALFAIPLAPVRGDDDENEFAAAIAYAQKRTVKLYGAGIGREPGYASGILVSADGQIITAQGVYLSGERLR